MQIPSKLARAQGTPYFTPGALQHALDESSGNSRHTIVLMSPERFLALALAGHDDDKAATVARVLKSGDAFNSLPLLRFENGGDVGRVTGHEGRHRMRALQARGVRDVPVLLSSVGAQAVRWSRVGDGSRDDVTPPRTLVSEDGMRQRPMPMDVLR